MVGNKRKSVVVKKIAGNYDEDYRVANIGDSSGKGECILHSSGKWHGFYYLTSSSLCGKLDKYAAELVGADDSALAKIDKRITKRLVTLSDSSEAFVCPVVCGAESVQYMRCDKERTKYGILVECVDGAKTQVRHIDNTIYYIKYKVCHVATFVHVLNTVQDGGRDVPSISYASFNNIVAIWLHCYNRKLASVANCKLKLFYGTTEDKLGRLINFGKDSKRCAVLLESYNKFKDDNIKQDLFLRILLNFIRSNVHNVFSLNNDLLADMSSKEPVIVAKIAYGSYLANYIDSRQAWGSGSSKNECVTVGMDYNASTEGYYVLDKSALEDILIEITTDDFIANNKDTDVLKKFVFENKTATITGLCVLRPTNVSFLPCDDICNFRILIKCVDHDRADVWKVGTQQRLHINYSEENVVGLVLTCKKDIKGRIIIPLDEFTLLVRVLSAGDCKLGKRIELWLCIDDTRAVKICYSQDELCRFLRFYLEHCDVRDELEQFMQMMCDDIMQYNGCEFTPNYKKFNEILERRRSKVSSTIREDESRCLWDSESAKKTTYGNAHSATQKTIRRSLEPVRNYRAEVAIGVTLSLSVCVVTVGVLFKTGVMENLNIVYQHLNDIVCYMSVIVVALLNICCATVFFIELPIEPSEVIDVPQYELQPKSMKEVEFSLGS